MQSRGKLVRTRQFNSHSIDNLHSYSTFLFQQYLLIHFN